MGQKEILRKRLQQLAEDQKDKDYKNTIPVQAGKMKIPYPTFIKYYNGTSMCPIDNLVKISQYYKVSTDYLLGLSNVKSPNTELQAVCNYTGLSESSIDYLASNQQWGINREAKILDFLILDAKERPKSHHYRSILDLLTFFFRYKDHANTHKEIYVNGSMKDGSSNGFISPGAIALNQRIIENAVLNEITQALISLKENLKKEEGENNG